MAKKRETEKVGERERNRVRVGDTETEMENGDLGRTVK